MVTEGSRTFGGEHTIGYTDIELKVVHLKFMLLTNITSINNLKSINK